MNLRSAVALKKFRNDEGCTWLFTDVRQALRASGRLLYACLELGAESAAARKADPSRMLEVSNNGERLKRSDYEGILPPERRER